jgi:hypothetical protein
MVMTLNIPDAQFSSDFTIDKVQAWSTTTDSSTGLAVGLKTTIPACTTLPTPQLGTGAITNPFGVRGLPQLVWSIDQTNWYPTGAQIIYFNATYQEYITQVSCYLTCSDSQIIFNIYTGYTAAQTVYFQLGIDSPT